MDLYGDLPPASGDGGSDIAAKPRLISSSTLEKPQPQAKPAFVPAPQPTNNESKSVEHSSNAPLVATKVKDASAAPSSSKPFLSFKPRQTKVTSVSNAKTSKQSTNSATSTSTPVSVASSFSSLAATTYSETIIRRKLDASPVDAPPEPLPQSPSPQSVPQYHEYATTYEVEDAYDPTSPNDYMVFCEERNEKQRQFQLEITNKRRLEEMERTRLAMERERQEASERGDIAKLQQMGAGRGRNVSNLPAWMTQGRS